MTAFLRDLAQARPDPGGGAAAAYGAALGLALLEKVVRLEGRRRQAHEKTKTDWEEALVRLQRLAESLARLQEEDVRAYFNLTGARASGDAARLAAAVQEAVDCPRRIMGQVSAALELLAWTGERCQRHLISDLLVAGEFLGAAFRGAQYIAGANLPLVAVEDDRRTLAADLEKSRHAGEELYQRVQAGLIDRMAPHDCHEV